MNTIKLDKFTFYYSSSHYSDMTGGSSNVGNNSQTLTGTTVNCSSISQFLVKLVSVNYCNKCRF